ncbi:MAG: amidohydrolase family protein, partial [Chloroflexi bacterium]|nr:amidohydrolase family protein [Chloroflexota bacterium]
YPNVYLKYSAQNLKTLEPAGESEPLLRALVQRFGARRIMWGSNFPATYDRSYGELVDQGRASVAFLPEADQRWVLGETALSLWPELRPA